MALVALDPAEARTAAAIFERMVPGGRGRAGRDHDRRGRLPRPGAEPQVVEDGHVRPTETPGTGLRFSAQALEPHRVA